MSARASDIAGDKEHGLTVWPVIEYADIEAGRVPAAERDKLRQRGCLVVRSHFPRQQALAWDAGILDYVESNRFFETYRGPGDDCFGSVVEAEIYPIYWSPAQMEARQSERMAVVQRFLNSFWRSEPEGVLWFDTARGSLYPDRIRRRPEGASFWRPRASLGSRHPGPLDDGGIPEGLPPPL